VLAKQSAKSDRSSDSRLKLAMDVGEKTDEAAAFGNKWPDAPDHLRVVEEILKLSKQLSTGQEVDHDRWGGEEFMHRLASKHGDE
jgi:alkanesulfonate monooxygenase SsuD/methylene tetrahydromethanopterin reductase-like flavin-dependent oxidoreductase (luciferase family)